MSECALVSATSSFVT